MMNKIHIILAYALLSVSFFTQPMDKLKKKKVKKSEPQAFVFQNWAMDVRDIILGKKYFLKTADLIQRDKNFLKLKPAIQSEILGALYSYTNAQQSKELSNALNTLVNSNDQLNLLINDSVFSLDLIKQYSHALNISNTSAAKIIATDGALKRLKLQEYYSSIICSNFKFLDPLIINEFYASDFDLSFTDKNNRTLGENCVIMGNTPAVSLLLKMGADPLPMYNLAVQFSESESEDTDIEDKNLMMGILKDALIKRIIP